MINEQQKSSKPDTEKPKKRIFIISGIILIVIIVGAVLWFTRKTSDDIKTITVKRKNLKEIIDISGGVESEKDVVIKSVSSGVVVKRYIDENTTVSSGTPLIEIDPQQTKLQFKQAEINAETSRLQAETELANAEKTLADARVRHQSNIDNLVNQINKVKNTIVFLEREYTRSQNLYREGAISRQTLDNQRQQLEQAKIDLRSALDNINKVKNEKGEIVIAQNRIAQARTSLKSSVRQGQAAISIARDALQKTTIAAPFKGTITKWQVNQGDFVSPGLPLCRFQDLQEIRVRLPVNELDIAKININDPVEIVFDAFPDIKYPGKVIWKSEASISDNENVQVFPVKVKFANPDNKIKPGMSGDAQVMVSEKKNVIAVPLTAIRKKEDKIYVNILEDEQSKEVEIKPGASTLDELEVLSGLKAGDKLIIEEVKQ